MDSENKAIFIVGTGISGLVCASELEKAGYKPILLEKAKRVGGRIGSDKKRGWFLDHGFQVLLTQYPAARVFLNQEDLDLVYFRPGAIVFKEGKKYLFGDPLRQGGFFLPTLSFPFATIADKIKVWKLAQVLKRISVQDIFKEEESTTMYYLQQYGFSQQIIQHFFQPFFTGIFLEPELNTSSRMFRFVYKMFAEGKAAIPRAGMQAIPDQLHQQLKQSEVRLNTGVSKVEQGKIYLENGETVLADAIVLATDRNNQLLGEAPKNLGWKSCTTFYFSTDQKSFGNPIIGLIADEEALINSLYFPGDVQGREGLISVTVVKSHQLSVPDLEQRVRDELFQFCKVKTGELLGRYEIPRALPNFETLSYAPLPTNVRNNDIFLAGDYLANGSLNAAMESGRMAASQVIKSMNEK